MVTRQDLLLLIKLGAFAWTGLSRGQLALAEQYYAGAGAAVARGRPRSERDDVDRD